MPKLITNFWLCSNLNLIFSESKALILLVVSTTRRRRDIKIPLCRSAPVWKKFNIVSNDHGRTKKCDFPVLDRKYPFRANLVQEIKIVSLNWNFVPGLIWTCKIQWWCSLFLFLTANTIFGQIWSKKSKF